MIKKWMIGIVALIILLNLAGCGNENLNSNINSNITVEQNGNAADKQDTVSDNKKDSADSEIVLTDSDTASSDRETTSTDGKTASNDSEFPTTESETASSGHEDASSGVDVDLTQLSSTMVYSEVYNMFVSPEDYIGKTIKMKGAFSIYQDETTDKVYYTCIIADATACCSQGLEFVWKGEHKYPEDYPELDSKITVTGEFQTYEEDGALYCTLIDAEIESIQH